MRLRFVGAPLAPLVRARRLGHAAIAEILER
jgi:hypothetical protein